VKILINVEFNTKYFIAYYRFLRRLDSTVSVYNSNDEMPVITVTVRSLGCKSSFVPPL